MAPETQAEIGDPAAAIAADVEAAIAAGDWRSAYETSNRAISRGLRHPSFFIVRARRMEETGHLQFALEDFQRASALAPGDAGIHEAVGLCAMKLQNFVRAAEAFDAALALNPDAANVLYRRGLTFAHLGDHRSARRMYQRAIELDPNFADALASLASIEARSGEADNARALAAGALDLETGQSTAAVALVQADLSQRRYTDAEEKLNALLSGGLLTEQSRPSVLNLLGDALDGQKRYGEAFEIYSRANEELQRVYAPKFKSNLAIEAARSLVGYFENEPPARWKAPDEGGRIDGAFAGHVFLLGFMRSGTTLLEQVLAGNRDIAALEEKGLLSAPGETYLTSLQGLDDLAKLEGAALKQEREAYWRRVRTHLPDSAAKVFVDKQPLNTSKLPLIAKMFPSARILFAIRDPRDVVFSCFRRNLRITGTQYDFLSLESCARFYASLMRLAEVCRGKFALNVLDHRYEDMVEDFDGRIRAVCDFIGVEWAETMRNFSEHASVADLRSPSAMQVRRPLYGEGVGQWRRYREQLKPILPVLEPWAEKFGYPRD